MDTKIRDKVSRKLGVRLGVGRGPPDSVLIYIVRGLKNVTYQK